MPPTRKYHTEEERKAAIKAQRKAYEARNPEIVREKRRRENLAAKAKRNTTSRVCKICGVEKPMADFAKKGPGRLYECLTCKPPKTKEEKVKAIRVSQVKYAQKVKMVRKAAPRASVALIAKKHEEVYPLLNRPQKPSSMLYDGLLKKALAEGWSLVCGFGDMGHGMFAMVRGPVILFLRLDGVKTYGVLCDDTGKRYPKISQAETAARRVWG